jgi:hypothetical protein
MGRVLIIDRLRQAVRSCQWFVSGGENDGFAPQVPYVLVHIKNYQCMEQDIFHMQNVECDVIFQFLGHFPRLQTDLRYEFPG